MSKDYSFLYKDIELPKKVLKACDNFGEKISTKYIAQKRNQNSNKVNKDHAIGKKGECVVYLAFKEGMENGWVLDKPDFKIYKAKDKSWDADLILRKGKSVKKIHIKTQEVTQSERFGLSWIFQFRNKDGKGGKDSEIFRIKDKNSFVCFVSFDNKDGIGKICYICSVSYLLKNKLFKDPKKESLHGIKKCVYAKDIKNTLLK